MSFTLDLTKHLVSSLGFLYPYKVTEKMVCVEIGSFEGGGSIVIHNYLCSNENSILNCIDPFDDVYVKGNKQMAFWDKECEGQLSRFRINTKNYTKIKELMGKSDDIIETNLEDDSVDFVYIDGDHSPEQVYKDAVNMFSKMKVNSIMLFDDYMFNTNGVITANGIDKFLNEYANKVFVILKNWQLAVRVLSK
jgi:hypothetical protein